MQGEADRPPVFGLAERHWTRELAARAQHSGHDECRRPEGHHAAGARNGLGHERGLERTGVLA